MTQSTSPRTGPSGAPPPASSTRRSTGAWSRDSIASDLLRPEAAAEIPWVTPEKFRAIVYQASAELGFGSQHDVKRPDLVVVERDLALDRHATRARLFFGVTMGVAGLLLLAGLFTFPPVFGASFSVIILVAAISALLAVGGLTVGTESRWQSEIIRVRVDPALTRVQAASERRTSPRAPLRLLIFQGRVTSSSSSTKSGTYRTLLQVISTGGQGSDAKSFAVRLQEVAPLEPDRGRQASSAAPSNHPVDPNLVPVESDSKRPVWYAYPKNMGWLRATALMIPMMLLIWGPMALVLPWDFQHVSYETTSAEVQSMPMEAWSPTGSTWGELSWSTYNALTGADQNDYPVEIATCPAGVYSIDLGTCHASIDGPSGAVQGDTTISIQNGWHLVLVENSTALCHDCKTEVSFGSPAIAWGLAMTVAGIGVAVPAAVYWVRLRARVKSTWPE